MILVTEPRAEASGTKIQLSNTAGLVSVSMSVRTSSPYPARYRLMFCTELKGSK